MRIMQPKRAAVVVIGATIALVATAVVSCALEGDVFTLLPDAQPAIDTTPAPDSALPDTRDTAIADTDPFETDLDGAWIHCYVDAACHLTTDQCCIWASIDPYCTEVGTCPEGGVFECDRASQCEAGLLCCAEPAAFTSYGKCQPSCPGVQLCQSNGECVDGGHCSTMGGVFATCQSP